MNLISRNCLDGFITHDLLYCKNNNPFIWLSIGLNSFYFLIENYDNIDFKNVIFFDSLENYVSYIENMELPQYIYEDLNRHKTQHDFFNKIKGREIYYGIIDNKILICSIHYTYQYLLTKKYCEQGKNGLECMYLRYFHKLKEMTEAPIFICDLYTLSKTFDLNSNYEVIYYTNNTNINRTDLKYFINTANKEEKEEEQIYKIKF
jgi:hypothetical protein